MRASCILMVSACLAACSTSIAPVNDTIVLSLTILRVSRGGVHLDGTDGGYSYSEAEAKIVGGAYSGRVVYLSFPDSDPLTKLRTGDTLSIRADNEALKQHLEAVEDPAMAYSHLKRDEFSIVDK